MATSLNVKMGDSFPSQLSGSKMAGANLSGNSKSRVEKWELKMSLIQLLLLWGVFFALTIAIFFVGYYAGREQGQKLALEDHDVPAIRLPISQTAAIPETTPSLPVNVNVNQAPSQEQPTSPVASTASGVLNPFVESNLKQDAARNQKEEPRAGEKPKLDFTQAAANVVNQESAAREPAPAPALERSKPEERSTLSALETKRPATSPPVLSRKAETSKALSAEKPKKTEDDVRKTEKTQPPSAKGWFVQLSATDTRSEATAVARRAQAKGFPVTTKEARVNGILYFRVLVGPFTSKNSAEDTRAKIGHGMGGVNPFVKNY